MEYTVIRRPAADWGSAGEARIEVFNWHCAYRPLSLAQLCLVEGQGLAVRMRSYEENPVSTHNSLDAAVHKDSCLEFFVDPYPEKQAGYLNFECNHLGWLFINYGPAQNRQPVGPLGLAHPPVETFSGCDEGGSYWGVAYCIPFAFFQAIYGEGEPPAGHRMRGGFFKCGDETGHSHYGSWTPIDYPFPRFHLPQFFGELVCEGPQR